MTEFFDRGRITAGSGAGRRSGARNSLMFLVESWAEPGSGDPAAVLEFLESTEVFGSLDRAALRGLLVHLEPVHLGASELMAAADALLLVGSGRVAVDHRGDPDRPGGCERPDGPQGPVGEYGPGQVVGAAALLRGEATGNVVRAVRDSLLLRLSAATFEAFAAEHPRVLLGLCRQLARLEARSSVPARDARTVATVALVGTGGEPVPGHLVSGLAAALAAHGATRTLSAAALEPDLGPGGAQVAAQDPRNGAVVGLLHRVEQRHRFVLYVADPGDTVWTRRCVRQADRVLLVGRAGADPEPGVAERALAAERPDAASTLVLLHPPTTGSPVGTAAWLAPRRLAAHHHLRDGDPADLRRLARHLAGRACGLVLGGGGMRGFAHLGVLRALEEAGVEVDVVGGTSSGAIMGALFAAGLDHDARLRTAVHAMVEQGSMVPMTLPLVSFSSGAKVSRLLREVPAFLPDIEDLWRSYFCVSASLRAAREVVHDRGPVWRAIRASIAIPGVFPPVPVDGEQLVDGGVLNNLPVDVMAARIGDGPVVAVDVNPVRGPGTRRGDRPPPEFDVSLSGWRVLASRLHPRRRAMRVPRLGDTLLRSLSLASARAQRARLADRPVALHLRPPVGTGGLLDFAEGPALVEPAHRYTLEALEKAPWPVRT